MPDNWLLIGFFAALAIAVLAVLLALRRGRNGAAAMLVQQLQTVAATQQAAASQLGQLTTLVTQQLGQLQQSLQQGLSNTAQLASQAQQAVAAEIRQSHQVLARIHEQLGQVQKAGGELSEAARTLEKVLGAAQTRGSLGEVVLERLLEDCLPQSAYELQYRFPGGEQVDAVVHFRDRLLPIDSKFPMEDYRRLEQQGEEARRAFATAVRGHADSISRKYILPDHGTLEIAFMFVPSEGIYYELLFTETAQGMRLDAYCRSRKVIPVSPNTLYGYLSVILMGMRGMQVEENARRILASLSGLEKQLEGFAEVFGRLGTHLSNAQKSYEDADRRMERVRSSLSQAAQGTLTEGAAPTLDSSTP